MHVVERQAIVPYTARAMYALVDDVERYPDFLPWCSGAQVLTRDEQKTIATLDITFRGIRQQFTTENANEPGEWIRLTLVRGPFRSFQGEWRFTALGGSASKVELTLSYALASVLLGRVLGPVFNHIANSLLDAFVRRADELYGA